MVTNGCDADPRVIREAQWLAAEGHDVTIHAFDRLENLEPESQEGDVRIIRHRIGITPYGGTLSTIRGLQKFRKSVAGAIGKVDLLHCHDADTLPLIRTIDAKRTLFDMHDLQHTWARMSNPKSIIRKLASKRMKNAMLSTAKSVDSVITSSEYFSTWLSGYGIESTSIENRIPVQETLVLPESPVIGYFGKIRELATFELLIEALSQIDSNQRPSVVIAGDGVNLDNVKNLARKNSDINIEFLPPYLHSELPLMMKRISMMFAMYPPERGNITEGALPSKMFEAAAYGRPSIVNRDAPMGRVCESESLGRAIDWGDAQGLAAAINDLHGSSVTLLHDSSRERGRFIEVINRLKI